MSFRRYMILVCVMISAALGDTFLSAGMKEVGPISPHHLVVLAVALKNPWVSGGILLLIVFFASYLTALSWADLTFVLPATSFSYVIIALLSQFWLQEDISLARWAGILLITLGVGFVTQGPSYTHPATASPQPDGTISAVQKEAAKEKKEHSA